MPRALKTSSNLIIKQTTDVWVHLHNLCITESLGEYTHLSLHRIKGHLIKTMERCNYVACYQRANPSGFSIQFQSGNSRVKPNNLHLFLRCRNLDKFSYQCGEEEVVIFSHHPHGQDLNRMRNEGVIHPRLYVSQKYNLFFPYPTTSIPSECLILYCLHGLHYPSECTSKFFLMLVFPINLPCSFWF